MTSRAERPAGFTAGTDAATVEEQLARAAHAPAAQRQDLLDAVVVAHLGLARAVARRYRDRGEPVEDLVQVANLALVMAVRRYRPGRGVSFVAFAVPTITGELRRYFRDRGWDIRPPRRIQELRSQVQAAMHELTQELGRTPRTRELAERLDVDERTIRETLAATAAYRSLSLDAPSAHGSGQATLADLVGAPDEVLEQVVELESVRPLLARLGERDRHILALRFYCDFTQQEIADDIGVTQMQVSRLLSQTLSRLRRQVGA